MWCGSHICINLDAYQQTITFPPESCLTIPLYYWTVAFVYQILQQDSK